MGSKRRDPIPDGHRHCDRSGMDLRQLFKLSSLYNLDRLARHGTTTTRLESLGPEHNRTLADQHFPSQLSTEERAPKHRYSMRPTYNGYPMLKRKRIPARDLRWPCILLMLISLVPGSQLEHVGEVQHSSLDQSMTTGEARPVDKVIPMESANKRSNYESQKSKPEVESMVAAESFIDQQVSPYASKLGPVQLASIISVAPGSSPETQLTPPSAKDALAALESNQAADNMITSASKKKKKMMKKKKKMEKKHKEWKKGKKHKKKKYESKKKKGGSMKKKKGKKEKKKWGMEKKGHKKKGNFKKKKWGSKKKMKKGHKKGKKGHKMLKDKGHKKKGFKKVYHKEEWGKKKKWHDIKREKKWNTKQKKWKKKWHQEKGKKYKGKHMKKYHKKNKHGKKYKKEKKSKWKKHKGEKFKKGHKKKKEEYSKKKEGGKKKKMKKMMKKKKKG